MDTVPTLYKKNGQNFVSHLATEENILNLANLSKRLRKSWKNCQAFFLQVNKSNKLGHSSHKFL